MSMIYRNVAGQQLLVYAWDKTTGLPMTGDAANISCEITKEPGTGSAAATNDATPTEIDATNHKGWYAFDLTQDESNAEVILFSPVSTTSNILIEDVLVHTQPKVFTPGSAAGVPSTTTIPTNLGSALTANAYANAFVFFTSGAAIGQRGKITASSTDGTLTIESGYLVDAPASGDTFIVIGGIG